MRVRAFAAAVAVVLGAACADESPGPFRKRDGIWHYREAAIIDADVRTFAVLDDHHAKDRQRVFYADTHRDAREYFSIAHPRVRAIEGADAASFAVIGSGYAKDRANVYYEGSRFAVRDAASFELLSYGFARDRTSGYYHQVEIAGSDGPTLAALDGHHAKDRARVFHATIETDGGARSPYVVAHAIEGADPSTFETLDAGYAKDARRVYHRGRVVVGADAATFVSMSPPVDGDDGRDARARYSEGKRAQKDTKAR